jgi:hypothetical protein
MSNEGFLEQMTSELILVIYKVQVANLEIFIYFELESSIVSLFTI